MKNYIYLDGKKIEISEETAKNLREQFKGIPCPVKTVGDRSNRIGICFGEDQALSYDKSWFVVDEAYRFNEISCVLVPTLKEDLKKGDMIFFTNYSIPDFGDISHYGVYLNGKIAAISDAGGINMRTAIWGYYYKIVKA